MKNFKVATECRLCKSKDLDQVLDFGEIALANEYLNKEDINKPEPVYPLTVDKCSSCGNVQLRETVNPDILFKNYLYSSSQSKGLVDHFKKFSQDIVEFLDLKKGDFALEIGSNDGITLKSLKAEKLKILGVEPAENLAKIANDKGLETINKYFNLHESNEIKTKYGLPKLIFSSNTYAHLSEHESVTSGVKNLMDNDTVFVFENSWLFPTIREILFDQFYHDHLLYLGVVPLVNYFNRFGMEIFKVEETSIQGGSIRCYVKLTESPRKIDKSVEQFINKELDYGLYSLKAYQNFHVRLQSLRDGFRDILVNLINEKKTISCFGCPAKFALFCKVFNLDNKIVKYVVDDSKFKQNLFAPHSKIPIVARQHFIDNPTDVCILSAWNFAASIKENNKQYKGSWISPMINN